jgi:AraC family transcriptional regulator
VENAGCQPKVKFFVYRRMHRSGEYFGTHVAVRQFGSFALSVTDYAAGSIGWHHHGPAYLTWVARGGYCESVPGSARECSPDSLICHSAGEVHRDDFLAPTRCINIQPDPRWLAQWNVTIGTTRVIVSPEQVVTIARIRRELRCDDELSSMAIEGLLHELMSGVLRSQREGPAPRWLRVVRDEISSRFRETLTLASLASAAGVHPVHLARSFRRHFGATIGEMIRERRVAYAKERIRAGIALSEIACETGFADQSHFTRTFRSVTGLTPGEFRRGNRVPER